MNPKASVLLLLTLGCAQPPSLATSTTSTADTATGGICLASTSIGVCGQPQVVKRDGTLCPAPSAADANTCNHHGDPSTVITSCSTVMNFLPDYAGRVNSVTGSVETGWFELQQQCCVNGFVFGPGVSWGETKICCQVMEGQSPAGCDTPCGPGGGKGCAACGDPQSGGPGGSCTITAGEMGDDNCQGDGPQYYETITIQDATGCTNQNGQ